MALARGSRLGPYEIVAPLGAGGMGEVYRARDPRLGRDVAIKLLPDAFASDPERLSRFEREAKLLASLQHANIAVLHGLEEANGRRFLVMQCVEGESLAQRLSRGPVPVADAMEFAVAIAAALEAAHESGIVHRDLKPGNVMVTPGGDVKVLDFGLAKGSGGGTLVDTGLSASPTQTYAATNAGVILGTAAYMSPEQARGKAVDRRTDIWSFGCVLYEMLTGRQAFAGETVSDIVACILQTEPDWSALPASTPGRLRDLLVRCLQKDARRRLRDIGDARVELEDLVAGRVSASGAHLDSAHGAPARPWLVPALAALVVLAAAGAWISARVSSAPPPEEFARFTIASPHGNQLPPDAASAQLSPDGRTLAMIASDSTGVPRIWLRRMDTVALKLLAGTEGATLLFWSPDSRNLGFFANDRRLFRVAVSGGDPEPICGVKSARGGTWNAAGVILLAPYSEGAIYRVPAGGGDLALVVRPDSAHGETALRFPSFLPDGKHFLYAALPRDSAGMIRICIGSLDGRPSRELMRAESCPVYARPGWLLFTRYAQLVAQRFDTGALALRGEPVALGDVAQSSPFTGTSWLSCSTTGNLLYAAIQALPMRIEWLDFQGRPLGRSMLPEGTYLLASLSPEGHRVLVVRQDERSNHEVCLGDLDRGALSVISPPESSAAFPSWSPDGRRIAYMSDTGRQFFVVRTLAGDSVRTLASADPAFKKLDTWSGDGRFLIYERLDAATKWDLWAAPVDGSPGFALAHTSANEEWARSSPDGRWLAYQTDETGHFEIVVTPLARPGERYQVSTSGGQLPCWSRGGRRILYQDPRQPQSIMAVDVIPGAAFATGPPHSVGQVPPTFQGGDIDPRADRILGLLTDANPDPPAFTLVQDWPALLRRH